MPPKKKTPTFEVPSDIPETPQSGWVYRTESETPPEVKDAVAAAIPVSERTQKIKEPFDPLRIVWLPLAMFCSIVLAVVPSRRKR